MTKLIASRPKCKKSKRWEKYVIADKKVKLNKKLASQTEKNIRKEKALSLNKTSGKQSQKQDLA
ncbi:hypothetical protein [Dickeya solani]|uniref:Uncharacterized protein n=1 Tax=Dickeya solani TaxID=1089444 RepID=A0ABU4EMV6_9GAMM|nr:hypothetical protein [Dickeya solani]MCA7000937.1 hypothetical protein [Dickeya solani]MCZ0821721.1 hypothetical protein [Dickeya solani]MDV6994900.1 hypothetical protein [Dickeya solani]MDV7006321.1 hypothetical protein [Dickeya solani]MDV7036942.1 hypothetical protein [Dickeya solani]